jgi:hypothetical protein
MEFGREEMHVQGCVSAEKCSKVRNMENDPSPFPLAALANDVPK